MQYDVIIIGAGPGGFFSAYELSKLCPEKRIAVFEEGQPLEKRRCPIDGKTVKHCVGCPTCAIMNGFGVPLGLLGAFVWRLPIASVYLLLSLEERIRFAISMAVFRRKRWMRRLG